MSELGKCPGSAQSASPTQKVEHHEGGIVVTDESGAVTSAQQVGASLCPTCSGLVRVTSDGVLVEHDWIPPEPVDEGADAVPALP